MPFQMVHPHLPFIRYVADETEAKPSAETESSAQAEDAEPPLSRSQRKKMAWHERISNRMFSNGDAEKRAEGK